jgi:hypothetical protein
VLPTPDISPGVYVFEGGFKDMGIGSLKLFLEPKLYFPPLLDLDLDILVIKYMIERPFSKIVFEHIKLRI